MGNCLEHMNTGEQHKNILVHSGVISEIKQDSIVVTLEPNLHCESCHAKGSCGASGSDTKYVEVYNLEEPYSLNDKVKVNLRKITGLKAVLWAYIVPFSLMFFTLIIASVFFKEWIAGLLSLFILLPYYCTLYLLKNKLKTSFRITILKT